jgi:hypothetical protein
VKRGARRWVFKPSTAANNHTRFRQVVKTKQLQPPPTANRQLPTWYDLLGLPNRHHQVGSHCPEGRLEGGDALEEELGPVVFLFVWGAWMGCVDRRQWWWLRDSRARHGIRSHPSLPHAIPTHFHGPHTRITHTQHATRQPHPPVRPRLHVAPGAGLEEPWVKHIDWDHVRHLAPLDF